jgi:hypothetical protein
MPWLKVNQTRLSGERAVPTPLLALEVHRAELPGQPGASPSSGISQLPISCVENHNGGFATDLRRADNEKPIMIPIHAQDRGCQQDRIQGIDKEESKAGGGC